VRFIVGGSGSHTFACNAICCPEFDHALYLINLLHCESGELKEALLDIPIQLISR